jgi:uracil-DNA glycosylase
MTLGPLLRDIRACTVCVEHLPAGPRPIVQAHREARILIIGQAPGRRVHESGIPWDDPSGDRLREWLGIDKATFYGKHVALVPMGFCYPGTGRSGDLPPRKECAELWHARLLAALPAVELTLLLSRYALAAYLDAEPKTTLTASVAAWRSYAPAKLPMPHPSPRNNLWLKKNPWFEAEVLPYLRRRVRRVLR